VDYDGTGVMSFGSGAQMSRAFARAARVRAQAPAILTCAVSGGIVTGNPNQPVTLDDVVEEALAAARAGASVVHVHARSPDGGISGAPAHYEEIARRIREADVDVLLNLSSGGELGGGAERPACLSAAPDIATLLCGSVNFGPGDGLLLAPRSFIDAQAAELAGAGVCAEYECFDLGMVATAAALAAGSAGAGGMIHLIMGSLGGAPADPGLISRLASMTPEGVPWAITSIPAHFSMMAVAIALGGHIRTGLEDVLQVAPGEQAASNAQLVERARSLCEAIGRPVASAAQAREILGIGA